MTSVATTGLKAVLPLPGKRGVLLLFFEMGGVFLIYVTLRQVGVSTSHGSDGFFCGSKGEKDGRGIDEKRQRRRGRKGQEGRINRKLKWGKIKGKEDKWRGMRN